MIVHCMHIHIYVCAYIYIYLYTTPSLSVHLLIVCFHILAIKKVFVLYFRCSNPSAIFVSVKPF